jgi:cytoskeleton protein RodZ
LTENAPAATPQAEPSPAAPQTEQRKLVIIALAECWVHSTADGTDTRQFSLRKGDTFALTFSKKLVLKLGNAGGVQIRLDGQELGSPGEAGQVKTLTYPASP